MLAVKNKLLVGALSIGLFGSAAGATVLWLDNQRIQKRLADSQSKLWYAESKIRDKEIEADIREQESNRTIERVTRELQRTKNLRAADRASADVSVNSLLQHLAEVRARIPTADIDTARADAARAGDVLGRCTTQYRDMAAEAQRLVDKISGLQDIVEMCHAR